MDCSHPFEEYYLGRENPPHPEIWINYFLRMVLLYSNKVCDLQNSTNEADVEGIYTDRSK